MGISEKLAYLNETKNQIKSALNTPYNVFRDYPTLISKYVKNQPKSIVEGSSAICENAIDLPCNVTVNGNSYQETTETSPSTENPSEIEVITECSLVQRGKNIFVPTYKVDDIHINVINSTLNLTDDEYQFTATGKDMYFGQITSKGNGYTNSRGTLYNVKGKSKIYLLLTNSEFVSNYINAYDSNKKSLGFSRINSYRGSYNIPEGAEYITLRIGYSNATVGKTYKTKVMLSFEEITDYEKYKEPKTIAIDLAGEKLAKVNLEDNLIIGVNGSVNAKKITKEYILTGDETSLIENYVTKGLFQITLDNVSTDLTKVRAKSNYLKGTTGEIIRQTEGNYLVSTYDSNRIFFKINDFANDLQGFRAWLKEKYNAGTPLRILYETTEPTTIELPSIEPITLFEGTNVFELITNLGTTIKVEYIVNAEKLMKARVN